MRVFPAGSVAAATDEARGSRLQRKSTNWSRREAAYWLREIILSGPPVVIGIDHALSFPRSYFERYRLQNWPQFLEDFEQHWPTATAGSRVEDFRQTSDGGNPRTGQANEYRLTELWTSSAKSVFHFDVQGSVAKSTHAGIPWIHWLKQQSGAALHCWPFDGWEVPRGVSVIAEAYPTCFRHRYPSEARTADQHDAYSISRWLSDTAQRDSWERYFNPPLTDAERHQGAVEGWILGVG